MHQLEKGRVMKYLFAITSFTLLLLGFGHVHNAIAKDHVATTALTVAGWIERVYLEDFSATFEAKLDTGAKTSSINAPDFKIFTRNNAQWVKFSIQTKKGETINIERPVTRIAHIRRARVGVFDRPVIKLTLCLAGHRGEAEFTLADRSKMNYPILIGRTFLADRILIDSKATYLRSKTCGK